MFFFPRLLHYSLSKMPTLVSWPFNLNTSNKISYKSYLQQEVASLVFPEGNPVRKKSQVFHYFIIIFITLGNMNFH